MINKNQLTHDHLPQANYLALMAYTPFNSPVDFIHDLSKADSLQAVLDTIAYWISHVFDADRASITL